jgi:hypothetical protein
MLPERNIPGGDQCLDLRELGGSEVLLSEQPIDRPGACASQKGSLCVNQLSPPSPEELTYTVHILGS